MTSILVTGTSSGFGFFTVKTLLDAGHEVFATMRESEGRNADKATALREAASSAPGTLHVLELDVTDEASVERAVASASAEAGHLDVVVNNAGFGTTGQLECFTIEQFQRLFDVNVFGVQRVMRAVLPHMRARRQGLVITVGSGIGRYVVPFLAPYALTKFALEVMTDSYSMELAPFGIDVALIQPGAFGTSFFANAIGPADQARVASYGEFADLATKMLAGFDQVMAQPDAPSPQLVADKIAELVAMPAGSRPLRSPVDTMLGEAIAAINGVCAGVQAQIMAGFQAG